MVASLNAPFVFLKFIVFGDIKDAFCGFTNFLAACGFFCVLPLFTAAPFS